MAEETRSNEHTNGAASADEKAREQFATYQRRVGSAAKANSDSPFSKAAKSAARVKLGDGATLADLRDEVESQKAGFEALTEVQGFFTKTEVPHPRRGALVGNAQVFLKRLDELMQEQDKSTQATMQEAFKEQLKEYSQSIEGRFAEYDKKHEELEQRAKSEGARADAAEATRDQAIATAKLARAEVEQEKKVHSQTRDALESARGEIEALTEQITLMTQAQSQMQADAVWLKGEAGTLNGILKLLPTPRAKIINRLHGAIKASQGAATGKHYARGEGQHMHSLVVALVTDFSRTATEIMDAHDAQADVASFNQYQKLHKHLDRYAKLETVETLATHFGADNLAKQKDWGSKNFATMDSAEVTQLVAKRLAKYFGQVGNKYAHLTLDPEVSGGYRYLAEHVFSDGNALESTRLPSSTTMSATADTCPTVDVPST